MSESVYKKKCVKLMRDRYGAKVIYLHGSAMQEPGLPDTMLWTALPFVWHGGLEFKAHEGRIRPVQKNQSEDFNKRVPCSYLFVREHSERSADDGVGHLIYHHQIVTDAKDYKGNLVPEPRTVDIQIKDFDVLEAVVRLYSYLNVEVDCSAWERMQEFRIAALKMAGLVE